jgi:hypothetical protein
MIFKQDISNPYNFKILSTGYDHNHNQQTRSREKKYLKFLESSNIENDAHQYEIYCKIEKPEIIRLKSLSEPISIEVMVKNIDKKSELFVDEIQILDQSGSVVKTKKVIQRLRKCKKKSYFIILITKIMKLIATNRWLKSKKLKFDKLTVKILRFMLDQISRFEETAKNERLKTNIDIDINNIINGKIDIGDCLTIPVILKLTRNEDGITLTRNYTFYQGSSIVIQDCLGKNWYPGDQHVHSTHSKDGNNTIADLSKKAEKIGFSYLIITDHSHSIRGREDWGNIREECEKNTEQNFICMFGEEVSCDAFNRLDGGYDFDSSHLLSYNISKPIGSKGPINDRWPDVPDPRDAVDAVHKQGGFCFAAHSFGTKVMGYRWNEWNNIPDGLVIWSYVHNGDREPNKDALKWWQKLLNESKVVYGIGDSDAHSIDELGHVWTWVLSESLEPKKIHDALAHGNIVFSNGPFSVFYINDGEKWHPVGSNLHISIDDRTKLLITWESREEFGALDKIDLIINGEILYSLHPDEQNDYKGWALLEFVAMKAQKTTCRIESMTKTGKLCYSNPIWLCIN